VTIRKLLVANRGEIARRIMSTAASMGIRTVAVYSDADAAAPFVIEADEAVRIGPPTAAESYLSQDALLDAARRTNADAVHPGYGFLSENAGFAQAVVDAGLIWVGPSASAIEVMGSKAAAKALMEEHGVPVVPGYAGEDQSDERLDKEAREVGFPVLLKASAGGGGKGMRVVREAGGVAEAIAGARREAISSFGDGRLLIERYVDRPRHIEFQIFGDTHGNLIHLFERECSIQRRHQKILEEAPSPNLAGDLRDAMADAAVAAGRALGYTSAGTVEFIVAPDGAFFFLEVNTRLQVEHPVTELTTGLDLVAWQLIVAEGSPLPASQDEVSVQGHAIEARLYAEDPLGGFLPATGTLLDWSIPEAEGVRVDSGVEKGSEVSVHYDPMLAKVIAYGADRAEATRRLSAALERASILGVTTNRRFLCDVLALEAWHSGDLHTHFIEEHSASLMNAPSESVVARAAVVATVFRAEEADARRSILPAVAYGWRNSRFCDESFSWTGGASDEAVTVAVRKAGAGWHVVAKGAEHRVVVLTRSEGRAAVEVDGHARTYSLRSAGSTCWVHDGRDTIALTALPAFPDATEDGADDGCVAPMPGKVLLIAVTEGDAVEEGDTLVVIEAMKMEHTLSAPTGGTVGEVLVEEGQQVEGGAPLVVLIPPGDE